MKKTWKIVVIVLGTVLFLGLTAVQEIFFNNHNENTEYKDERLTPKNSKYKMAFDGKWAVDTFFDKYKKTAEYHTDINWVIEEQRKEEAYTVEKEIHRFDGEEAMTLIRLVKEEGVPKIRHDMIFIKEGQYSVPYGGIYSMNLIDGYRTDLFEGEYDENDKIAGFLCNGFWSENELSYANDGKPIYYGIATDSNIRNLRVSGEAPTDIIQFTYNNKTYYYWYYEGISFIDAVSNDMDYAAITLPEVERVLDICFQ